MPIEFNDAAFVSALKAGRVGKKVDEMRYGMGLQGPPKGEIFEVSMQDRRLGDELGNAVISTILFSCLVGDQIQYGAMISDPTKYQDGVEFLEFKSFDQLVTESKISSDLAAELKVKMQSAMKPKMVAAALAIAIPENGPRRLEQRTSALSGIPYSARVSDPKDGITREDYPASYAFIMKKDNLEYRLMSTGDVEARRNPGEEFASIESVAGAASKDQVLEAFNNPARVAQASTSRPAVAATRPQKTAVLTPPARRAAATLSPQQPPQVISAEESSGVINAIRYYQSAGNSTPVSIGGAPYLVTGAEYEPGSGIYVVMSNDGSEIRLGIVKKEGAGYTVMEDSAPGATGLMFDRLAQGHKATIDAATKYYSDYSPKSVGGMTMAAVADGVGEMLQGTYAITNLSLESGQYIAIFTPEDSSKRPIACTASSNSGAAFIVGQQPSADSERNLFNGLASAHQKLIREGHVAPVAAVPSRAENPAARGAGLAITAPAPAISVPARPAPAPRVGDSARGPAVAPVAAAAFDAGHGAVVDSTRAPAARSGVGGAIPPAIPRLVTLDVPVKTVLDARGIAKNAAPGDKRIEVDTARGVDQEVPDTTSKYFSLGNVGGKEMAIQYRSDDTMFLVSKDGNVYKPCKMDPTNPNQAAEFDRVVGIAVKAMANLKTLMAAAEAARPAAAPHAPISASRTMTAAQATERAGATRGGDGRESTSAAIPAV